MYKHTVQFPGNPWNQDFGLSSLEPGAVCTNVQYLTQEEAEVTQEVVEDGREEKEEKERRGAGTVLKNRTSHKG